MQQLKTMLKAHEVPQMYWKILNRGMDNHLCIKVFKIHQQIGKICIHLLLTHDYGAELQTNVHASSVKKKPSSSHDAGINQFFSI